MVEKTVEGGTSAPESVEVGGTNLALESTFGDRGLAQSMVRDLRAVGREAALVGLDPPVPGDLVGEHEFAVYAEERSSSRSIFDI